MQGVDITDTKPDILVHTPGNMGGNLIIIEVKPINAARNDIRKDLRTLTAFQRNGEYYKSLYLIYWESSDELNRIVELANSLVDEDKEDRIDLNIIELYWNSAPEKPATIQRWEIESQDEVGLVNNI